MTPQFDFLGVPVSDMARSVAFYRLLGLEFPDGAENEQHVEALQPIAPELGLRTANTADAS
jgi:predicted lactoylglutathione lyase